MNFLCPACRTPLPRMAPEHVTCSGCGVEVDLTRVDTAPGQARLWPEIDLSGETLSGHALLKLLGSGGMGSVYEARSPDGTIVALKVLSPLLAADPALRERFRREARALSALSHPGIVKMFGEGEERSFCWYAMERVSGMDLRERLKAGPLPAAEVVALGKTMLDALEVVHAAGFVHRDVKPSNILLSPEGPKLCDFGIARLEGANTLTESAALLGSLRYMAPEQRWGKSDARSDLYALGVVLHEALALGVPGERTLPPSTPSPLARAIAKMTEANAVRRPPSARAAKQLLLASSRRPLLVAGAAAALVMIATVGGWFALGEYDWSTPKEADDSRALALAGVDSGPVELAALTPDAATVADSRPEEFALADAGEALDAGVAVALATVDAGNPLLDLLGTRGLGTKGTSPPPKGLLRGGKPMTKLVADTGTAFEGLGTKGSPKKKMKPSKVELTPEAETPRGLIRVQGTGAATVSDGKKYLGEAPGEFSVALGGHAIVVTCATGGKPRVFKVGLSEASPSETLSYQCSEK